MSLASASSKSDGHSASKQDSKSDFWSLLRMLCLDKDGGQSAFSTSSRRSLFLSLTCIVMYSCLSKCLSSLVLFTCWLLLRYLCRLPRRWMLFILIGAWNDTDVDCKRCATKSACCLFPSPSAPVTLRATLSGILSGVDNDHFVTILVKRVTCLLKCYDQCLGVCGKKNLCWTLGLPWRLRTAFLHVSMPASNSMMTRAFPVPPKPTLWRHTHRSYWRSHHASSALYSDARVFDRIQSLIKGFASWQWWNIHQQTVLSS